MTQTNNQFTDTKNFLSEIQIVPVKPKDGLVAFASIVLNGNLYLGSIAIMTRPEGGYRLLYPSKKIGLTHHINYFYPINKPFAEEIEATIIKKFEEVHFI